MKILIIIASLLATPALAEVIVSEHGGAAGGICYGVSCGK
jgi:hypothetical protein